MAASGSNAESVLSKKKKLPPMEDLLTIISKNFPIIESDDIYMLEFLSVDSSELAHEHDGEEIIECSTDNRSFALNLYYFSPSAYEYVLTNYYTCLPPVPIVRTWFVHKDGSPGFTEETLTFIGEKVEQAEKKIYCTLILQQFNDYYAGDYHVDGEGYYGFHDVGTEVDIDCNNRASSLLVMTAAAVNASWSLPIGYFLMSGDSKEKMGRLLTIAIFLLKQKDVEVIAISLNWRISYKQIPEALGCEVPYSNDMNNIKLLKFVSENHKDIIVIPEIQSLLNEILWALECLKQFKNSAGAFITWKTVDQLEGKSGNIKKNRNIELNEERLERLIDMLQRKDEFESQNIPGSEATKQFLNCINDLLDIFNLLPKQQKIVTDSNKANVIEKLEAICEYFKSVEPPESPKLNLTGFCIAAKGVQELIRLYLDTGVLESISFNKMTSQPNVDIFAGIRRGSRIKEGSGIKARPFKIGYNKAIKTLIADSK